VSSGPFRGRSRHGLRPVARPGSTKRKRVGLSVIPPAAFPTVAEVLEERGWLGVMVLLAVCYLQGTNVPNVVLDKDRVVVFAQRRTRSFPLSPDSVGHVQRFLDNFKTETEPLLPGRRARYVAEVLANEIEPEVRRRLRDSGHRWAKHVNVSTSSLRRAGIEQLLETSLGREYLRAYTRNPRAHPEDAQPPISLQVMAELDSAVAPFWTEVGTQLSPEARTAISNLAYDARGHKDR